MHVGAHGIGKRRKQRALARIGRAADEPTVREPSK